MPSPALVSTITLCPWRISSRTLAGTSPTRYSWVLISFGTPISMMNSSQRNSRPVRAGPTSPKGGQRSVYRFQHIPQDAEHLVYMLFLADQGWRERDDVAGG